MKINKNVLWGVGIGIAVISTIVVLRKFVFKSNKDKIKELTGGEKIDTSNIIIPESQKAEFPLKYGSKGEKVKDVQRFINYYLQNNGKPVIKVDGDWGNNTNAGWKATGKDVDEISETVYKSIKAYLIKKQMLAGGASGMVTK